MTCTRTSYVSLLALCCFVACGPAVVPQDNSLEPKDTPVAGGDCTQDEDCITGELCDEDRGVCSGACADDDDCDDDLVCVDTGVKQYCGENDRECTEDSDCDTGDICTDEYECKTPVCPKDRCPSGYGCQDKQCVRTKDKSCRRDADCSNVQGCTGDKACTCTANVCVQKAPCTPETAGTSCKNGEICDNGECKANVACTNDTQCPIAYYCESNGAVGGATSSCVVGCRSDIDCPGAYCDTGSTPRQCVTSKLGRACANDTECDSDNMCMMMLNPSDMLCHEGKCRQRCTLTSPLTCGDIAQGHVCVSVNADDITDGLPHECGASPLGGYSYCDKLF